LPKIWSRKKQKSRKPSKIKGLRDFLVQFKLFPLIKPQKAKSLAISRLLAFSISIVPHNVPQILGVFEVPQNQ